MGLYKLSDLENRLAKRIDETFAQGELIKAASSPLTSFDIFLSHSYLDAKPILSLKEDIESMGFSVYVDWIEDSEMNRAMVTRENANMLRERMNNCKCLFFAFSGNAKRSVWMPWELGYMDAVASKVAILPILGGTCDDFKKQEYLELYPYITRDIGTDDDMTLWVNDGSDNKYVHLKEWLQGKEPSRR